MGTMSSIINRKQLRLVIIVNMLRHHLPTIAHRPSSPVMSLLSPAWLIPSMFAEKHLIEKTSVNSFQSVEEPCCGRSEHPASSYFALLGSINLGLAQLKADGVIISAMLN